MRKIKLIQFIVCLFSLVFLVSSCVKEGKDELGTAGKTIVKFYPAETNLVTFKPIAEPQTGSMFEVRKDVHSSSSLNATTTVTVKWDGNSKMLDAYNAKLVKAWVAAGLEKDPPVDRDPADYDGPVYTLIDKDLYYLDPVPTALDSTVTFTFGPGEIGKRLVINVPDASQFDFALKYAMAFKMTTVTGAGVKTQASIDTIVVQLLALNKYDGLYLLKGVHNRVPYDFPYETEMEMRTTGASSVAFFWPDAGSTGHPIGVGPDNDLSWYGSGISPVIDFDPNTNEVADVYNTGSATVITKFTGAGANDNKYDPVTKTIYVSWNYNNNPLRAFFDTMTFISER